MIGVPDPRWDADDLHRLNGIKGSDFEAVDLSDWPYIANSGRVDPMAARVHLRYWGFSFLPAGLHDFAAGGAGAALVCPLMVGRYCRRFRRRDSAAIIATGLEVVALLFQVCIKIIENRLVDQVPPLGECFTGFVVWKTPV